MGSATYLPSFFNNDGWMTMNAVVDREVLRIHWPARELAMRSPTWSEIGGISGKELRGRKRARSLSSGSEARNRAWEERGIVFTARSNKMREVEAWIASVEDSTRRATTLPPDGDYPVAATASAHHAAEADGYAADVSDIDSHYSDNAGDHYYLNFEARFPGSPIFRFRGNLFTSYRPSERDAVTYWYDDVNFHWRAVPDGMTVVSEHDGLSMARVRDPIGWLMVPTRRGLALARQLPVSNRATVAEMELEYGWCLHQ